MTRTEFHTELQKLLYLEDFGVIDILCATVIANSLKFGDPVWMTIIGPSSGGKSQLIRPFGISNGKFIHQLDDLTANTLLSGTLGLEASLLGRIGTHGILSMDDLTVLFSKGPEERAAILSQFRMLYDGRFSKSSGNRKESMEWRGHIGMIAGSTPSIYRYFNEVADMGERFLSYRMRPVDKHKAVQFVTNHQKPSKQLNEEIGALLTEYLIPHLQVVAAMSLPALSDETKAVVQNIAEHATLLRTPVHVDERTGLVDEFPEPEMPFRVMKQLNSIAIGLQCMQDDPQAPLEGSLVRVLEWTGYSLANDKRRAYLRSLVALNDAGIKLTSRNVSSATGLHSDVVKRGLDQLQALGIVSLANDSEKKEWSLSNRGLVDIVRRLDPVINISDSVEYDGDL